MKKLGESPRALVDIIGEDARKISDKRAETWKDFRKIFECNLGIELMTQALYKVRLLDQLGTLLDEEMDNIGGTLD